LLSIAFKAKLFCNETLKLCFLLFSLGMFQVVTKPCYCNQSHLLLTTKGLLKNSVDVFIAEAIADY
jgi:hypothetical protein